jgi:signal transduction histidine kinase
LPSAVGSAAYRILQESITNVIRHVGPTRVTVALTPGSEILEIRVTDEGRRTAPGDDPADPHLPAQPPTGTGTGTGTGTDIGGSARPGRGILGMRERCRLLGGELDARPLPGGGFEVKARLPLAPTGSPL